jgi:hypothetical protein
MPAAVAQPARFVAGPDATPVPMRDVEDLHDADLDQMLAEGLDAFGAVAAAQALAALVAGPAVAAHDLGAGAARLALR